MLLNKLNWTYDLDSIPRNQREQSFLADVTAAYMRNIGGHNGHTHRIIGIDTAMISISSGRPMRQ